MKKLFSALAVLAILAGCASQEVQKPVEVTEPKPTPPTVVAPPKKVDSTPVVTKVAPPKVTGSPLNPLNPDSDLYKKRSVFYDYDSVIVKSPQCERHMFRDWAARYIDVDAPGSTSANVCSLGHTIAQRPLWPLDAVEHFTPKARIFRRPV